MNIPSLSGLTPTIPSIIALYEETLVSLWDRERDLLSRIASGQSLGSDYDHFINMTEQEIKDYFKKNQNELDALIIIDMLASAEGLLRNAFEASVQDPADTSPIAYDFRLIAQYCVRNRKNPPIDVLDLLRIWLKYTPSAQQSVDDFRNYWKLRNWLAHGRWLPFPDGIQSLPSPFEVKKSIENLLNAINI